jgi:hypothetical protein
MFCLYFLFLFAKPGNAENTNYLVIIIIPNGYY